MLTHPTLDQMQALGLAGMATANWELAEQSYADDLGRDKWLGLMLDRKTVMRADRRLSNRLTAAKLRFAEACIEDLAMARLDGRFPRLVDKLARVQLFILNDWRTHSLTHQQRLDLLEIFEERYRRKSTLITAQLPVDKWHEMIGEPTIVDAILDRIIQCIPLQGESMRNQKTSIHLTENENQKINHK